MTKKNMKNFDVSERKKRTILNFYAAICFLLNFIRIFDNAFWGDEGWSIRLINMNLHDMIKETAAAQQPPLYFLIAMLFRLAGGNRGIIYHLVSLVPYLILVILAVTMIRRRFGFMVSMIFITFTSLSTSGLTYNVEARMYSWASLFVFCAWGTALEIIEKDRKKDWIQFTVFSILAAYTNYYALLAVGFLYLSFMIYLPVSHRVQKNGIRLLISIAAAAASYIPWFGIMIGSFQETVNSDFWLQSPTRLRYVLTFIFESKWLVIATAAVFCAYFYHQNKADKAHDSESVFVRFGLVCATGLIATGEIVSLIFRPVFQAKYAFSVCPVIWLVLGIAISGLKYRKQVFCLYLTLALVIMVPGYIQIFSHDYKVNKDTEIFQQSVPVKENDIILTNRNMLDWTLLDYYYPGVPHAYLEDADADVISGEVKRLAVGEGKAGIWLFWSDPLTEDDIVRLKAAGYNTDQYFFGRLGNDGEIHIYRLK